MKSVIAVLEGVLVKESDPFSYFMLVAFEASGPIRFALLLLFWPIIRLLGVFGLEDIGLRLTIFIAVAGLRISEIEYVGRAVLPKFYIDHVDIEAWRVFTKCRKKVVVTKTPRVMVEWFVKDHLEASDVIGTELVVNRFGFATGLIRDVGSFSYRVTELFGDEMPNLGLRRSLDTRFSAFMSVCKEQSYPPYLADNHHNDSYPTPVIFHDGRLVRQPKPLTALIILCWIPVGVIVALIRILCIMTTQLGTLPREDVLYGITLTVKGNPKSPALLHHPTQGGVLFACTHRTLLDAIIVSYALRKKIPILSFSNSRLAEILAPIPLVKLTRNREIDAKKIKDALKKDNLIICPEGTTSHGPYLLRFSALFAELTDRIVPVALNYKPAFFYPTTVRGWKALDVIYFALNPSAIYEVTFLDQLPFEETCSAGLSSIDVANLVQRKLATTLGFKCTNLTRKDKYMLAANHGAADRVKTT